MTSAEERRISNCLARLQSGASEPKRRTANSPLGIRKTCLGLTTLLLRGCATHPEGDPRLAFFALMIVAGTPEQLGLGAISEHVLLKVPPACMFRPCAISPAGMTQDAFFALVATIYQHESAWIANDVLP